MAWTGAGAGTIGDPWQITTREQLTDAMNFNSATTYMKLMNDIDFSSYTGILATWTGNLRGKFDGNNKRLYNLGTGHAWNDGLNLYNNFSLTNITVHYNRLLSTTGVSFLCLAGASLDTITLSGVHVIAEGAARFLNFASNAIYIGDTSTVTNITIEGNFRTGFACDICCGVSYVRFYRTISTFSIETALPRIFSVVTGLIYRCQIVVPSFIQVNQDVIGGMIVKELDTTTIIRQCRVLANINVTQLTPTGVTHTVLHVLYAQVNGAVGSIVEDNLIEGNFYLNGGEEAANNAGAGKSGYILGPSISTIQRRNIFNGDLANSYFNNRPPMSKSGITAYSQIGLFYNSTAIVSMTPTNESGKQTGLTSAQMKVQNNFTGYDFDTVWEMGANNPVLKNNPIYNYEIPLKTISINSVNRISSSSFSLNLTPFVVDAFGIDILEGETIVFNSENDLAPIFTGITSDKLYTIKPYYYEGEIKTYITTTTTYQHYFCDAAVAAPITINETARVTLNNPANATYIHGSIFYNGYWYGTTRNLVSFSVNDGFLVRAPENNIGAFEQIPIRVSDPQQGAGDARYSHYLEQIVLCKGKLYATFYNESLGVDYLGNWVLQYDPEINDYKVYQIAGINAVAPIITDGEYLYFSTGSTTRKVYKVDPDVTFISVDKYNPNYNVPTGARKSLADIAISVYDEDTQGGYILGIYDPQYKGTIHSATSDSEFLYLAYTTTYGTFVSGYDPATGRTYCELHKVRKSDMTPAGWVYIPQCTDDMGQNATHLFLGVEVQPTANILTHGYGWGSAAIRKSDLHLTALPRLHANDNPPINQSYSALIFGNYLLDLRTNKYIVVIDISDVDNWLLTENVGNRTVAVFINKYEDVQLGVPLNDIQADISGNLYATYWTNPVLLSQFVLPDIDIYSIPILENFISSIIDESVNLSAYILSDGGQPITEKGFKYGLDPDNLDNTIISEEATRIFNAILTGLDGGLYYCKSYATNSEGTAYTSIQEFTVMSNTDTRQFYIVQRRRKNIPR